MDFTLAKSVPVQKEASGRSFLLYFKIMTDLGIELDASKTEADGGDAEEEIAASPSDSARK